MYTEVSSFQGVRIEEFHSIERCPHFRDSTINMCLGSALKILLTVCWHAY